MPTKKAWEMTPDNTGSFEQDGISLKEGASPISPELDEIIIDPSKNKAAAALMETLGMPTHDIKIEFKKGDIPEGGSVRVYLNHIIVEGFTVENNTIPVEKLGKNTVKIEYFNADGGLVKTEDMQVDTHDIS